jgi:hypothetical protein
MRTCARKQAGSAGQPAPARSASISTQPNVLLLSGAVLLERDNVGRGLREHRCATLRLQLNEDLGYNRQLSSTLAQALTAARYLATRKGPLAAPSFDIVGFAKVRTGRRATRWPDHDGPVDDSALQRGRAGGDRAAGRRLVPGHGSAPHIGGNNRDHVSGPVGATTHRPELPRHRRRPHYHRQPTAHDARHSRTITHRRANQPRDLPGSERALRR